MACVSSGSESLFQEVLAPTPDGVPTGWTAITAESLAAIAPRVDLASYFNGGGPDWQVVVNPGLRQLQVTLTLLDRTRRRIRENRAGFELLIAPSGEGKSTALMQAVVALAQGDEKCVVLWRRLNNAQLTHDVLEYAARLGSKCVVAADNAHTLLDRLHEFVRNGDISSTNGVQYMFASRDTDWMREAQRAGLPLEPGDAWKRSGFLVADKFRSGRVSKEDAVRIVRSWYALESGVPDPIRGKTEDEAAEFLSAASATSDPKHGALLGGLLSTRYTVEGLRGHLVDLLDDMSRDDTPSGHSLADLVIALAIVDVAGAEGIPQEIVADFCSVSTDEVRAHIETRLAQEAVASAAGEMLRGRHPRVSRAVLYIALSLSSTIPAEKHAMELIDSTVRLGEKHHYRAGYGQILDVGRRLSRIDDMTDLPEARLRALAVKLATHSRDRRPKLLSTHIGMSTALRKRDQAQEAVDQVWLPVADQLVRPKVWAEDWRQRSRSAFNELATALGGARHHGESALASGLALSDLCRPYDIGDHELAISLLGICVSLDNLYTESPDTVFARVLGEIHGCLRTLVPAATDEIGKLRRILTRLKVATAPCPPPEDFVDSIESVLTRIKSGGSPYAASVIWTTAPDFTDLRGELVRRWNYAGA